MENISRTPRILSAMYGGTLENVYTHGMDLANLQRLTEMDVDENNPTNYYRGKRHNDVLWCEWDEEQNLMFWWCLNGSRVRILIGSTEW